MSSCGAISHAIPWLKKEGSGSRGLLMIGFAHGEASHANQGQDSEQQHFGCVVNQAEKNVRIYWTSGDHETTPRWPLLRLSAPLRSALKLSLVNII